MALLKSENINQVLFPTATLYIVHGNKLMYFDFVDMFQELEIFFFCNLKKTWRKFNKIGQIRGLPFHQTVV